MAERSSIADPCRRVLPVGLAPALQRRALVAVRAAPVGPTGSFPGRTCTFALA